MANPVSDYNVRAQKIVAAIRLLRTDLERLAQPFRQDPVTGEDPPFNKWAADDWRRNIFGNALIRLSQIIQQNFNFIETFGVLAVARYIFELSIWLQLLKKDVRYGLIYHRELLATQLKYYEDTLAHLHREVALLNRFEALDTQGDEQVIAEHKKGKITDLGAAIEAATNKVDAEASRSFSIYIDDAKINGYGLQAHLVTNQAIPPVEKAVRSLEAELKEYERLVPPSVRSLVKGAWRWRQMALEVGLSHEHDYIYAFASKLLHATPSSLTTDKKNLEISEAYVFLRYIHVKLLEIMDLARQQPECKLRALI